MVYNCLFYRGVITVDVKLKELDINQCPADFYVANAFKNTAKCDFKSQYVSIAGFSLSGLKTSSDETESFRSNSKGPKVFFLI